jgi:hypothetical protein
VNQANIEVTISRVYISFFVEELKGAGKIIIEKTWKLVARVDEEIRGEIAGRERRGVKVLKGV